jgi:MYXO-CTERM domain-containing protein
MKKLLLTAAAILATLSMYGQGSGVINFANTGAPDDRRIWVNTTGEVGVGTRAAGTGYHIALYWGQRGTEEAGLIQIGAFATFFPLNNGTFSGGSRTVTPIAINGDIVTVQARGWAPIPGVTDSYDAVYAAGLAGDQRAWVGLGPVFDHDTSRPGDPTDPAVPIGGTLASGGNPAWRGFAISPVPEPSVIALGLLGVGALLMLRRRK